MLLSDAKLQGTAGAHCSEPGLYAWGVFRGVSQDMTPALVQESCFEGADSTTCHAMGKRSSAIVRV